MKDGNPLAPPEPPQIAEDIELTLDVIPRRKRKAVGGAEYELGIYGNQHTVSRDEMIALRDWIDYLLIDTSLQL